MTFLRASDAEREKDQYTRKERQALFPDAHTLVLKARGSKDLKIYTGSVNFFKP